MQIVGRATLVFFFVLILLRVLRKRSLGDMSPLQMLMLVVIGDLVQQGVTQEDYSVTGSALAIATFAFWVSVLEWLTWRSDRARRVVEGVPVVLIEDGQPVEATLALELIPWAEVLEAARQNGIEDIDDVRLAVLETSGKLSFITR
ncbi:MAG: DUF421 domain-containing protein [Acidimicrobiales bacterium]|nr:DUF421 domain-containing protein [Acidimicrobiales bacterium]